MAKYHKIYVGRYKRRDGTTIKKHYRLVKSDRGLVSRAKQKRAEAKGVMRKSQRGDKKHLAALRRIVKSYSKRVNSAKQLRRYR